MIRKAKLEDAYAIAKVHVDSWRTTYQGIIPEAFLNNLRYETREKQWQVNMQDSNRLILVVENDVGEIIGFADTISKNPTLQPPTTDLTSLYVLDRYHGKGIGKAIIQALFTYYEEVGYERVVVEVLSDNRTKYFYEYLGATFIREIPITIGGKRLKECIYMWDSVPKVVKQLQEQTANT